MTWIVLAVVIGSCAVLFEVLGRRPATYRITLRDLPRNLGILLRRGHAGAFAVIREGAGLRHPRFIQFSKYVVSAQCFGLEFAFPLSRWSEPYYSRVRDELDRLGIRYRVERTNRLDTMEFLNVDVGRDLSLACTVAEVVFVKVFGVSEVATLTLHYKGLALKDELVVR